jgi:hypothetical protein
MSETAKDTIVGKAKRMRWLMDEKDRLEAQLKLVNGELEPLRKFELPKLMGDAEIEKITVAGAGTLYTKADVFASMIKDEADPAAEAPFYDWARANAPNLVTDYIHPARLKSWAKEKLEAGEPLPNSINATIVLNATLLRKG